MASTLMTMPCSLVTNETAASTKLPVSCATNRPNSASTRVAVDEPGREAEQRRNGGGHRVLTGNENLAHRPMSAFPPVRA